MLANQLQLTLQLAQINIPANIQIASGGAPSTTGGTSWTLPKIQLPKISVDVCQLGNGFVNAGHGAEIAGSVGVVGGLLTGQGEVAALGGGMIALGYLSGQIGQAMRSSSQCGA
jgi:hypothetical protein